MYLNNKAQPQLYIELIKSNLNRFDKKKNPIGPIDVATSNFDCGFANDSARVFTEKLVGCELLTWEILRTIVVLIEFNICRRDNIIFLLFPFISIDGDPCLYLPSPNQYQKVVLFYIFGNESCSILPSIQLKLYGSIYWKVYMTHPGTGKQIFGEG